MAASWPTAGIDAECNKAQLMRIGVTTNRFDPDSGGMERQAYDIVEVLVESGVATTVITKKARMDLPIVQRLERLVQYNVSLLPGKLRDKYFSWRLDRGRANLGLDCVLSCNRIENADFVVCGGTHMGTLKGRGRRPRIYDRLYVAMERKQFSRALCIATCSKSTRKEIVDLYGEDGAKIHVVYPAIDARRFTPCEPRRRRELRERFGFSPDKKIFLFPSFSHARKGLPFLLRFFEKTSLPVELVVVGRKAGSGRNVRSFGPSNEMEALYQAADATVMASQYEPFGMVAVESVLCGTPVILTDNMGCCEVLREPAALVIAQNDIQALGRSVQRILDDDAAPNGELRQCIAYDFRKKAYVDRLMELVDGL